VPTRVLREQLGERVAVLAGADFSAPVTVRDPKPAAKSPAQEERSKRPDRPKHSWRKHEEDRPAKKLRRQFRGSRRDHNKRREPSAEEPRAGRAGLLTDRKGRRILVERHGEAPQQKPATQRTPEQKPFARAAPKRNRHRPRHRPAGGPNRRPQRP
jgi:23S rRNA pseudouridine2605 synthase